MPPPSARGRRRVHSRQLRSWRECTRSPRILFDSWRDRDHRWMPGRCRPAPSLNQERVMKRRAVLFLAVLGVMIALAALGSQKKPGSLLVLDWAAKASVETPPVAVLIELGVKDDKPTPW